jgi:hypothetical protein
MVNVVHLICALLTVLPRNAQGLLAQRRSNLPHLVNVVQSVVLPVKFLMVVKVRGKCVVVLRLSNVLRALHVLIIQMIAAILLLVELIVPECANAMSTVLLWTASPFATVGGSIQLMMRTAAKVAVEI